MCCGSLRSAARAAALAAAPRSPAPVADTPFVGPMVFEHVGPGPAEIRGAVSGRTYRFSSSGDRLAVDPRDRPGLAAMPSLRRVR
jgi:hypothetical protein